MQITIINKSDRTGGAAVAALRLAEALREQGQTANMVVEEKRTRHEWVHSTLDSFTDRSMAFARFAWERLCFLPHERDKSVRFAFSPAIAGAALHKNPIIQQADLLHLHWFNQGFLSIKGLEKLVRLGKPMVWTLHDMWAFTGGCHYSGECTRFVRECKQCPFLRKPAEKDMAAKVFARKEELFARIPEKQLSFVTCSRWLGDLAQKSALLQKFDIHSVANPLDTSVFYPMNKEDARKKLGLPTDKKLLLFGSANIHDTRKGLSYLLEAIHKLQVEHPQTTAHTEVVVFGKSDANLQQSVPLKVHTLGQLNSVDSLVNVYSAADVFVLPSLEDNLPNTIMEALACGTPVLAFASGGIPEMIDHLKTGYLADYRSADSLAQGIQFLLTHESPHELSNRAREYVLQHYTPAKIAAGYRSVYQKTADAFASAPYNKKTT